MEGNDHMPDPIYTSHQGLINLANRECGYKAVWVENGAQARWSNKGNLVIEHQNGSEDVCKAGRVISSDRGSVPSRPVDMPRQDHGYDRGDSGRVQDLIRMAESAKRNTNTYAEQDRQVSQILDRAIDFAGNADDVIAIAAAAKSNSATYATQDRIVTSAMAKGEVVLHSAGDAVRLADSAKRNSATYATQDRTVEGVLTVGARMARSSYDFDDLKSAAKRNTATYATQDRVLRRINDEQLNAIYR
jgi:hypothetical protein